MSSFLSLERSLGYTFRKPELLSRALTHRSFNLNPAINADHLEFIGSSSLYLAILKHLLLHVPATTRGWEIISLVDQISSSTRNLTRLFDFLEIDKHWKIRADISANIDEKLWLIYAISGALFKDGGPQAISHMVRIALGEFKLPFAKGSPTDLSLPWGPWSNRISINLDLLNFVFPRNFSIRALRLLPWALETHLKPGVYNQRSSQFFELGEATLRWAIDLKLWRDNILEPSENRHLHRQKILRNLGLTPRQDQTYASGFGTQDWRRQSLDHRVHSLKNILGAVLIADGEACALEFAQLILNRANTKDSLGNSHSIVVSHVA